MMGVQNIDHFEQNMSKKASTLVLVSMYVALLCLGIFGYKIVKNSGSKPAQQSATVVDKAVNRPMPKPNTQTEAQKAAAQARAKDAATSKALQAVINNWVAKYGSANWAVSINGSDTGVAASVNSQRTMKLASIYKLFLTVVLARKIPVNSWSTTTISGGTSSNLLTCFNLMISVSDNSCAVAIVQKVGGWTYFENQVLGYGYSKTQVSRLDYAAGTAGDSQQLMRDIYSGKILDGQARTLLLNAMKAQKLRSGIPAGCAECTNVRNKTGDYGGAYNDVAVFTVDGKDYILTIFSQDATWSQVANLTSQLVAAL